MHLAVVYIPVPDLKTIGNPSKSAFAVYFQFDSNSSLMPLCFSLVKNWELDSLNFHSVIGRILKGQKVKGIFLAKDQQFVNSELLGIFARFQLLSQLPESLSNLGEKVEIENKISWLKSISKFMSE